MSETVYRFQVHYRSDRGNTRYVKFVADIRPQLHHNLNLRIAALISLRGEQIRQPQYMQRQVFSELWNAWDRQNRNLASRLPARFPEKWQALKKLREKEHGHYGNPKMMLELWDAWSRQHPADARKIERQLRAAQKIPPLG
jgi:hypothetical protein